VRTDGVVITGADRDGPVAARRTRLSWCGCASPPPAGVRYRCGRVVPYLSARC